MRADATPFLNVFEKKLRLEVPLFQRQYVWNLEDQWQPLWEDITRKFTETLEKRADAPPHFLGAMVLDQRQTPTTHVEKRQVIDGQQRLITFQIFLSALRDFCREQKLEDLANECDAFIFNKGMMADPILEKYKVWPTQVDRDQFMNVVNLGSREAIERQYPVIRRPYARKPEPRPRMVEAYLFFYDRVSEFFLGSNSDPPLAADQPLASRLEECFQTLKNALKVVIIDLDREDDAQIIFETLNARGEPLLPADLLRNFIFLRAARQGESQERLYEQYWKKFDDGFWREEIRQGRLNRPRSDLFLQHYLASRRLADIPITHLFVEYKYWIQIKHPFSAVHEELATLARQRDAFRRLLEPQKEDPLYELASFLASYDISTVYPLILFLLDAELSDDDWNEVSTVLESYLLRRAVCNLTTKNYNRNFLALTRFLQQNGPSPGHVREYLSGLSGESTEWPTDDAFFKAWQTNPVYELLGNSKMVHILKRLSDSYLSNKTEHLSIANPLTIEHILPQAWLDNWPLPDGSKGLTVQDLLESKEGDARAEATTRRNSVLHTVGNLTILTQPLNSAVSNSAWPVKKPQLLQASLLPINQQLHQYETWDEGAIERRGKELFERAKVIWPAPSKRAG